MGLAFAVHEREVHLGPTFACLVCALLLQIGANFVNDYFDFIKGADTAKRTGPARVMQAGLVTPLEMKLAIVAVFTLSTVIGFYLVLRGGLPILIIGVASIFCAILYTAGPFPLGYIGAGEICVLPFFGPIATAGTYYAITLNWSAEAAIAGIGPGFLAVGVLVVNNLRDIETDSSAGKRTLAVRFGRAFARWEYLCCLIIPSLIACFVGHLPLVCLPVILLVLFSPRLIKAVWTESGSALNIVLARTSRLIFLYSVALSLAVI